MPQILPAHDPQAINLAAEALRRGELIVMPTDTVYGVAAWPWEDAFVSRLYEAKGRPEEKAIPLLVGSAAQLGQVTQAMPAGAQRLAQHFWPGPLTLVVPKHPSLPPAVSPYPTVGVRMPNHPDALALLRLTGPLAVTSANRSGHPPARTAAEAAAQLGDAVAIILDAGTAP
ncbi:MAG: threonylcarbamoyl-AMP synthase, partial [Chloroflexi bacterium]|nr:threonylcarbamoyl-AMP synthase [Chloroflexota bacterium]